MPEPYTAEVTAPAQFDGLTAATGLFIPSPTTGNNPIQILIKSVSFSGPTAMGEWKISRVDPSDGTRYGVICGTGVEMAAGGPAGFDLLPTNEIGERTPTGTQGQGWGYAFETTGMTGTGKLRIDWDYVLTEG